MATLPLMELKVVGGLAAGVALGFVVGGLEPRREAQRLEGERDLLAAQLEAQARGPATNPLAALLPGLARQSERGGPSAASPVPDRANSQGRGTPPDAETETPATPTGRGDVAVIGDNSPDRIDGPSGPSRAQRDPDAAPGPDPFARPRPTDPEAGGTRRGRDRLADFDRLASVQTTRIAASRAALAEQANLSEAEVERVDQTTQRMNDKLSGYGEEIITQMGSEEPPGPAQALGLGHDVSGILYEGQRELDEIVGGRGPEVDPEALAIWNYVDVEQWRPFVEAQQPSAGAGQTGGAQQTPGAAQTAPGAAQQTPGTTTAGAGGTP